MRVIAGSARRLKLVTPDGLNTRPTSDKIKETLFNIIQGDVYDSRFLELFAGSGGISIEALSRGAECAVLVESDRNAIRCIKENLKTTHFEEQGRLMEMDVFRALMMLKNEKAEPFDIIFMDPPYGKGLFEKALTILKDSCLIKEETLIIVEESVETDFSCVEDMGFYITKEKDYKNSKHVFMRVE